MVPVCQDIIQKEIDTRLGVLNIIPTLTDEGVLRWFHLSSCYVVNTY